MCKGDRSWWSARRAWSVFVASLCLVASWSGTLWQGGGAGRLLADEQADSTAEQKPSHAQDRIITVHGDGGRGTLHTFCLTDDGQLVALVLNGQTGYGQSVEEASQQAPPAEIVVLSAAGDRVGGWPLDFAAQRVTCAPQGDIVVAGAGWLARYSAEGALREKRELATVSTLAADGDLRRKAEERFQQSLQSAKQQVDAWRQEIRSVERSIADMEKRAVATNAAHDAKNGKGNLTRAAAADQQPLTANDNALDEGTDDELEEDKSSLLLVEEGDDPQQNLTRMQSMLEHYRLNLPQMEQQLEQIEKGGVDGEIARLTESLKSVHAIHAEGDHLIVVTRSAADYGFCAWQMTSAGDSPRLMAEGLSGCCGQMDVKLRDGVLFVAENGRHRVRRFASDGAELEAWGSRDREGEGGFGGCCNPMNICFDAEGNVLTAESQGVVKRFTSDGQYLGLVVLSRLAGGCKHAAVEVSSNGDAIYFLDQSQSRILVLERNGPEQPEHAGAQDTLR